MRTRVVRAAIAPISTIASSRGLAKIESPTHTESQPDESASAASCSISATVVTPMTTPRLGRVSPNFTLPSAISFLPRHAAASDRDTMAQLCAGKMYATRPGFVFNSAISGLETILAVLGAILLHLGRPGQLRRQASGAARAKPAVLNLQRPSLCETRTLRWSDVHSNPWFLDVP